MTQFKNSPFEGEQEVIATLADRAIRASINELQRHDDLTVAMRQMLRNGVSVDELSASSGLTPAEIKRRVSNDLALGEDLETLAGDR